MPRARLLWILIAVGAVCALASLYTRVQLERHTRSVDILIDYYALVDFCQGEGLEVADTLNKLQKAGTTAIAFPETTLERLTGAGHVSAYTGADLARALRAGQKVGLKDPQKAPEPIPGHTYLAVEEPQILNDLQRYLHIFLGKDRCKIWPAADEGRTPSAKEPVFLDIAANEKALSLMGLGFNTLEVEAARKAKLNVYLRPQNRACFGDDKAVAAYFTEIAKLQTRGLIFEGLNNDIVGYPDSLDATVDAMRAHGLLFGNIEVPTVEAQQKGSQTLGKKLSDLTVRVFSLSPLQQAKMTPDDVIDRYRLGTRERNMRVLYLRFFTTPEAGKSVLQTNLDYVAELKKTLSQAGFAFEGAKPFAPISPKPWSLIGMTLGAAAAGVLFLELFIGVRSWMLWAILIGLPTAAAAAWLVHRSSLAITGMALETAMVFSVLGLALGMPMLMNESLDAPSAFAAMRRAILPLVLVTGLSLLGGLYMAGLMSDTAFMLSVSQFRGIKLIMVAAPALVVMMYLTRYSPSRETFTDVLNKRVVFWHIAAVAALGMVAVFYVARTGNASPAAASDYERYVRDFLESTLVVRPRFKEFFLGHPAWFVMAVLLWKRRGDAWMWLLALAVAIGQVDVVDTFAHAHTPYLISLVRALIGLALGIVVGLGVGMVVSKFVREGIEDEVSGSSGPKYPPGPLRLVEEPEALQPR